MGSLYILFKNSNTVIDAFCKLMITKMDHQIIYFFYNGLILFSCCYYSIYGLIIIHITMVFKRKKLEIKLLSNYILVLKLFMKIRCKLKNMLFKYYAIFELYVIIIK